LGNPDWYTESKVFCFLPWLAMVFIGFPILLIQKPVLYWSVIVNIFFSCLANKRNGFLGRHRFLKKEESIILLVSKELSWNKGARLVDEKLKGIKNYI
jgi:hypothetical protein